MNLDSGPRIIKKQPQSLSEIFPPLLGCLQEFLDGIAVGEGGFEAVMQVWHCVLAPLATVLKYLVRVLDGQAGRRRAPAAATPE